MQAKRQHSSPLPAKAGERGFTLVEVLVALVASALLLTVIMNGALSAKTRSVQMKYKTKALSLASQKMQEAVVSKQLSGAANGEANGLQWRTEIQEIARDPRGQFMLANITVSAGTEDKPDLVQLERRKLVRTNGGAI